MKILFFDMEFADGKVPGSIYSFGYLVTDENFEILTPPTDLLINPESTWNDYVKQNILAYPMEEIEAAPAFPEVYPEICRLFGESDRAVGFSLSNDVGAFRKDCARYGLEPENFSWFDIERLTRRLDEHREARGLGGNYLAWCGEEQDHRHRSDGDALATMRVLEAICKANHADPEMFFEAYPECGGDLAEAALKPKKKAHRPRRAGKGNKSDNPNAQTENGARAGTQGEKKKRRRRPRHRKKKAPENAGTADAPALSPAAPPED